MVERLHRFRRPLITLAILFALSRAVFYWVGVRFDASEIQGPPSSDPWQLLDRRLLKTQLLSSIWHLQSQPPLFNLYCGLLLKLPFSWQEPVAQFTFLGLGLVMVLATYQTLVDLKVPSWIAFVVGTLVMIAPSTILYENWLSYAFPTAAAISFSILCCVRYVRTGHWAWGSGFLLSMVVAIGVNSSYQWEWFVVALAVVLIMFRARWRRTLVVAIVPLALLGTWYSNDYLQFGTLTTSSWLGMNMADIALLDAPPGVVAHLVKEKVLTPIAEVFPFSGVGAYVPYWTSPARHTGIPALDEAFKSDGQSNYNNLVFVKVSALYLHDDLAFVRAEPGDYLRMVSRSASLFMVPADEYPFVRSNDHVISHWTRLYDGLVDWQVSGNENAAHRAIYNDQPPEPSQIPYSTLLVWLLALLGAPVLAFRLRKTDRAATATLVFCWLTAAYAFVATSLFEFGENERFRFELGTPALIAGMVVAVAMVRWSSGFLSRRSGYRTEPAKSLSSISQE